MSDKKINDLKPKKRSERLSQVIDEPFKKENLGLLFKLIIILIVILVVKDYERAIALLAALAGGF